MVKNKVKLLLIEDYIFLNKISFACDSFFKQNLENNKIVTEVLNLKNQLLEIYEKIFFRFGLMDFSFLVLKKGFKNDKLENNSKCEVFSKDNLKRVYCDLKLIAKTLIFKLKKLSLNEIEMKYLVQNLTI